MQLARRYYNRLEAIRALLEEAADTFHPTPKRAPFDEIASR